MEMTPNVIALVIVITIIAYGIRWYLGEVSGANYKKKYPLASTLINTMQEKKIDAADASNLLNRIAPDGTIKSGDAAVTQEVEGRQPK